MNLKVGDVVETRLNDNSKILTNVIISLDVMDTVFTQRFEIYTLSLVSAIEARDVRYWGYNLVDPIQDMQWNIISINGKPV